MNIYRLALLAIISAPAVLPLAYAADATEAEKLPVYQVELLVFRHTDQSATTREIQRKPEPQLADVLAEDLARLSLNTANVPVFSDVEPEMEADIPPFWQVLPEQDLRLNDTANKLLRLDAYELLAHVGWLQTAADISAAEELDLLALGITGSASGHIKLYKRSYLHIALDIALGAGAPAGTNKISMAETLDAVATAPAISESRRVRLENLMYFDQPEFGVLAIVFRSDAKIIAASAPLIPAN